MDWKLYFCFWMLFCGIYIHKTQNWKYRKYQWYFRYFSQIVRKALKKLLHAILSRNWKISKYHLINIGYVSIAIPVCQSRKKGKESDETGGNMFQNKPFKFLVTNSRIYEWLIFIKIAQLWMKFSWDLHEYNLSVLIESWWRHLQLSRICLHSEFVIDAQCPKLANTTSQRTYLS